MNKYWHAPVSEKFFRDSRLCYECSVICDLNIQFLVPASERKHGNSNTTLWPRGAYKKNYLKTGEGDRFGVQARSYKYNNRMWFK